METKPLLGRTPIIINVGLDLFAKTLQEQGVKTIQVNWRPPMEYDEKTKKILEKILWT